MMKYIIWFAYEIKNAPRHASLLLLLPDTNCAEYKHYHTDLSRKDTIIAWTCLAFYHFWMSPFLIVQSNNFQNNLVEIDFLLCCCNNNNI